jgi:protein-S-isoprenylcysteine O-methyltransferase Ste14
MRIPPPLLFVVSFFAGVGLQRVVSLKIGAAPAVRVLGIGLLGCGVVLALYSLATFFVVRTTVVPFSAPSKLVIWGPYRFTRNPMYVALILAYLGVTAITSQILAIVFLPIPIVVLRSIVIPFEEERMRKGFGEAYQQYCSRVRRWL